MFDSTALNLTALVIAMLVECAGFVVLGELLCRWWSRFSAVDARLPELAFLLGLAGYASTGYATLLVSTSAAAIPAGVALAALAMWIYTPRLAGGCELPEFLEQYREWRATRSFRAASLIAVLFVLAVCVTAARGVDGMRTIGMPIALAAYGYPLLSPAAVEMQLMYPLGAFIAAAGAIAWTPKLALPVLQAAATLQAAFYAVSMLVVSAALVRRSSSRLLLAATCLLTFTAANHAIALAALLLAVVWFKEPRAPNSAVPLLLAAFAAATSQDITAMALVACVPLIGLPLLMALVRRQPVPSWIGSAILISGVASLLIALVNLPALTGKLDSPSDPAFPLVTNARLNAGLFLARNWIYILLLVVGVSMARSLDCLRTRWLTPLVIGMVFSFTFESYSIWFWRFTFAAHFLFGLLIARHLDALGRWSYAALWTLLLIPGASQEVRAAYRHWTAGALTTAERAAAIHWLYDHTALHARVAEYREAEGSLATDVSFLRTGNRAGLRIVDRSYPLIGHQPYSSRMGRLEEGIAYNDFILVARESREMESILTGCGAPRRFGNAKYEIFAVDNVCRTRLFEDDALSRIFEYQKRLRLQSALSIGVNPDRLPMDLYQAYVQEHPEEIGSFRKRLELLWGAGMWKEAAQWSAPIAAAHPREPEPHYSYAFSLHAGNLDMAKAIEEYNAAEAAGYSPFWIHYNRGSAYFSMKDYVRARRDLEAACALNPNHAGAREILSQIRRVEKR